MSTSGCCGIVKFDAFGVPFLVPIHEEDALFLSRLGRNCLIEVSESQNTSITGRIGISVFGIPYVSPVSKLDAERLAKLVGNIAAMREKG